MDSDLLDDSMASFDEESDGFSPEPKLKAKAKAPAKAPAAKKAAAPPKKMVQTTLTAKKTAATSKKRAKSESDDENMDDGGGDTFLSDTPPSAKKPKKAAASTTKKPAKSGGAPLHEIENDSIIIDNEPVKLQPGEENPEDDYQRLTQLEHIIKRPDTYIGSIERTDQAMWVYNKETQLMESRTVSYVPGLYKIFDEILVNAADNRQRDPPMTCLKVDINRETGVISVENNGKAIPVVMHQKEKVWIPELLFGHLLAGSNFNDDKKKTVGGRNGYGAKLCNVFSTEFHLEVQDSVNGKRYKQTWTNNMNNMHKAKITASKTASYVRVTFKPDYEKFGMPDGIDDDLEALFLRRVYDMVGTIRGIKVVLNGEAIKAKSFSSYCELYAKSIAKDREAEEGITAASKVYVDKDKNHPMWEVAFAVSDGSFQQVSFVNSIATTSGGSHVNYIVDQISNHLLKALTKKQKGHTLKASHIRNHIFIFINCLIENPAFNSQTKEQMTTKVSAFGSKCALGEDFLKQIAASDALNNIMSFAEKKADKMLAKSDGAKRSRINNSKLTEANFAGTKRGHECTLILTEGDSAKGLAVAGRAILDPDRIGVFPLRGKMLNVRDASIDQITKNAEIQMIKQILGLKHKQVYADTKGLRYGHIMIMTDQDHDGSHIKGLLINFLQVQFPSLLKIPEFLAVFITPIVKAWQGPQNNPTRYKWFFTMPEYEQWQEALGNQKGRWEQKYLKGLGSSTADDAQKYFNRIDDHLKHFATMKREETELFELTFSKKKADARKEWLGNFVPGTFLDHSTKVVSYDDFVNKELILFSMADNIRSIPSALDGFKPGQRKVMYGCFLKNTKKDAKVYELAGFISQKTAYHHGDTSLQQTIIALAQDHVGSNNINVLEPSGNFGSRLAGGADAASPRYIFTRLSPFARKIFSHLDEPVLEWQYDDNDRIEPKTYAPIVPMILVNGADGIGTGWSTSIPNYHPVELVKNIKRRMGKLEEGVGELPFQPMTPWFRGWKGTAEPAGPDRFKFNGIAERDERNPNEVIITELPIRTWTDDFKGKLEEIISGVKGPSWIKDYREFNDHHNVHFEIVLEDKHMEATLKEGLIERFKLTRQVATSNLVAFNTRGQIHKYQNVEEILEEFYQYRLDIYMKRKKHWVGVYHADYRKIKNQVRFIQEIIENKLVVAKKQKKILVEELRTRKYEAFPKNAAKEPKEDDEAEEAEVADEDDDTKGSAGDYDYLLSMPIWAMTAERLAKLKEAMEKKKAEHDYLLAKDEKDIWNEELDELVEEWDRQLELRRGALKSTRDMGRRASKKLGAGGGKGRGRTIKKDDDYQPGGKASSKPAAKPKAAPAVKVETKTHERFAEKFGGGGAKATKAPASKKPIKIEDSGSDAMSDDDYAALDRDRVPAVISQPTDDSVVAEVKGRSKRAAAAKPKAWMDLESDSNDDNDDDMLSDVGAMVKGIKEPTKEAPSGGKLSLLGMANTSISSSSRPAGAALPKLKTQPSKTFDFGSDDDTNYEMLAKSSPHKSAALQGGGDHLDGFSDDDMPIPSARPLPPAVKTSIFKPKAKKEAPAPAAAVKKHRGRPAGANAKTKVVLDDDDDDDDEDDDEHDEAKDAMEEESLVQRPKPKAAAPKPTAKPVAAASVTASKSVGQSPAAKAYAKKAAARRVVISDDEDDDDDDDLGGAEEPESPPPPPRRAAAAGRGRPARAAASRVLKAQPMYDDDSGDDSLRDVLQGDDDDESDDPFELDDD